MNETVKLEICVHRIPVHLKTSNCSIKYEIPIAGPLLGLTMDEFNVMASCYYDISARLAMILTTILQYPQLIDTIYPAVRALGEISEDEISKLDETEATALRAKLEALSEFYGPEEGEQ